MDSSIFQPRSQFFSQSSPSTYHYRILSVDFSKQVLPYYYLYLSPISDSVLPKPGQIIKFHSCKFYISDATSFIKAIYISGDINSLDLTELATIDYFAKPPSTKFIIMNDTFSLGSIDVRLQLPLNHKEGFLGWTLFADDIVLIVGNDLGSYSQIYFQTEKLWNPGSYRLVAALYEPYSYTLLNIVDKEFELLSSSPSFNIGTSFDNELPLQL